MTDAYNLHRFLDAQERVYDTVLAELRAGRKSSHWIWFIFPQIAGLGRSEMAQQFAIGSLDEAKTYLQHPTLGTRLRACTQLVLDVNGRSAEEIFGYPDHLKFRSCTTLFLTAATDDALFKDALLKYFDGKPDQSTLISWHSNRFRADTGGSTISSRQATHHLCTTFSPANLERAETRSCPKRATPIVRVL